MKIVGVRGSCCCSAINHWSVPLRKALHGDFNNKRSITQLRNTLNKSEHYTMYSVSAHNFVHTVYIPLFDPRHQLEHTHPHTFAFVHPGHLQTTSYQSDLSLDDRLTCDQRPTGLEGLPDCFSATVPVVIWKQ